MRQKAQTAETSQSSMTSMKEKFEAISSTPVTREVILKYKSCCGCGCSDVDVQRTVPYDSPLQSGDRIDNVERNDKML
jgi:hypothetical protein